MMEKLRSSKSTRGKAIVIGCMATFMPIGTSAYFGNILIYIYSYYQANVTNFVLDPLWIMTSFRIATPLGMLGSSYVSQKLGDFKAVLVFSAIQVSSSFLSFFSIDHPISLLVTFGLMQGISTGALFNLSWKICFNGNRNSNSGWATGLMSSGSSVGALMIIGLSYLVVNPTNEKSDESTGRWRYFTNPDVVHRVPYLFIMLGVFNALVLCIGLTLIYCALKAEKSSGLEQGEDVEVINVASTSGEKDRIVTDTHTWGKSSIHDYTNVQETSEYGNLKRNGYRSAQTRSEKTKVSVSDPAVSKSNTKEETVQKPFSQYSRGAETSNGLKESTEGQGQNNDKLYQLENSSVSDGCKDRSSGTPVVKPRDLVSGLTPRQMLQTPTFWLLWTISLFLNGTMFMHSNLYKQMGEVYLSNDALLTGAGILSLATMVITRPFNGHFVDTMGVKVGLLLTSGTSTIFITLMTISLHLWPPLYAIFVIGEFACVTTIYMQFHYAVKAMFGPAHYSTNVSLVFTASIPASLFLPAVVPDLVQALGWTHVFTMAAGFSCIALVLSLACPEKEKQYINDGV